MASFTSKTIKSVSTGKIEFRAMVGQFLDSNQDHFKAQLSEAGYSDEMAEKIIDAVLTQVFGFLVGPNKD